MGAPTDSSLAWSWPGLLLFRWVFLYCILQAWPEIIIAVPGADSLDRKYCEYRLAVARWTAGNVLRLDIDPDQLHYGGGDYAANYIACFAQASATLLVALTWLLLDRRNAHPLLAEFLRVTLRSYLAMQLLSYGLAKIIPPRQMAPPSPMRLLTTYGDSSPMGLLWRLMGASKPYTIFAGASETLGAVLLSFRRTALLGALVTAGVMANVFALNMCYDVPVKLHSLHLLLMAIIVITFDGNRSASWF